MSLEDASGKIERWQRDYKEFRQHSAQRYLTPAKFAKNGLRSRLNISFFSFSLAYDLGVTSKPLITIFVLNHNTGKITLNLFNKGCAAANNNTINGS
ncbi:MAG: hypothetical protein CVU95_16175 [Firmicutes bacterium HGW-Firmicutes-2]|jgi:hypothetical protein|nr:MAG: hypothetical protein CVU95_16175 [Firmicutes bacterium HGW-Firmicutes-2]